MGDWGNGMVPFGQIDACGGGLLKNENSNTIKLLSHLQESQRTKASLPVHNKYYHELFPNFHRPSGSFAFLLLPSATRGTLFEKTVP